MPQYVFDMRYQLEGGPECRVRADQRDVAEWEAQSFGYPVSPGTPLSVTFWRYITWAACRRTGGEPGPWPKWTKTCVFAAFVEQDPEAGGGDVEDPGRPGRSDTPS